MQEEFKQAWAEAMEIFRNDKPRLIFPRHLEDMVKNNQRI